MEKKYQKLYIWSFIIISGIILTMLYTPLGGNLHSSAYGDYNNYSSPGVNFNGGIGNAPKNARTTNTRNYNDAVPVSSGSGYSALSKPVISGNTGSSSHSNLQGGNYQGSGLNALKSNNTQTGGSAGGTGMIAIGGGGRSGGGNGGGGGFSGGGLFSTATPSSTSGGIMQKASNDLEDLADPGGGDPVGDPIPVGDGFYILILFVMLYGFFRYRERKKATIH